MSSFFGRNRDSDDDPEEKPASASGGRPFSSSRVPPRGDDEEEEERPRSPFTRSSSIFNRSSDDDEEKSDRGAARPGGPLGSRLGGGSPQSSGSPFRRGGEENSDEQRPASPFGSRQSPGGGSPQSSGSPFRRGGEENSDEQRPASPFGSRQSPGGGSPQSSGSPFRRGGEENSEEQRPASPFGSRQSPGGGSPQSSGSPFRRGGEENSEEQRPASPFGSRQSPGGGSPQSSGSPFRRGGEENSEEQRPASPFGSRQSPGGGSPQSSGSPFRRGGEENSDEQRPASPFGSRQSPGGGSPQSSGSGSRFGSSPTSGSPFRRSGDDQPTGGKQEEEKPAASGSRFSFGRKPAEEEKKEEEKPAASGGRFSFGRKPAEEEKKEEKPAASGGRFSFGRKPAEEEKKEEEKPATSGSRFSFGRKPAEEEKKEEEKPAASGGRFSFGRKPPEEEKRAEASKPADPPARTSFFGRGTPPAPPTDSKRGSTSPSGRSGGTPPAGASRGAVASMAPARPATAVAPAARGSTRSAAPATKPKSTRGEKKALPSEKASRRFNFINSGLTLDQKLDLLGFALLLVALILASGLLASADFNSPTEDLDRLIANYLGWGRATLPFALAGVGIWLLVARFGNEIDIEYFRLAGVGLLFAALLVTLQWATLFLNIPNAPPTLPPETIEGVPPAADAYWQTYQDEQMVAYNAYPTLDDLERASLATGQVGKGGGLLGHLLYANVSRLLDDLAFVPAILILWILGLMVSLQMTTADVGEKVRGVRHSMEVRRDAKAARQEAKQVEATAPVIVAAATVAAPVAEASPSAAGTETGARAPRTGLFGRRTATPEQAQAKIEETKVEGEEPARAPAQVTAPPAEKRGWFGRRTSTPEQDQAKAESGDQAPAAEPPAEKRGLFGRRLAGDKVEVVETEEKAGRFGGLRLPGRRKPESVVAEGQDTQAGEKKEDSPPAEVPARRSFGSFIPGRRKDAPDETPAEAPSETPQRAGLFGRRKPAEATSVEASAAETPPEAATNGGRLGGIGSRLPFGRRKPEETPQADAPETATPTGGRLSALGTFGRRKPEETPTTEANTAPASETAAPSGGRLSALGTFGRRKPEETPQAEATTTPETAAPSGGRLSALGTFGRRKPEETTSSEAPAEPTDGGRRLGGIGGIASFGRRKPEDMPAPTSTEPISAPSAVQESAPATTDSVPEPHVTPPAEVAPIAEVAASADDTQLNQATRAFERPEGDIKRDQPSESGVPRAFRPASEGATPFRRTMLGDSGEKAASEAPKTENPAENRFANLRASTAPVERPSSPFARLRKPEDAEQPPATETPDPLANLRSAEPETKADEALPRRSPFGDSSTRSERPNPFARLQNADKEVSDTPALDALPSERVEEISEKPAQPRFTTLQSEAKDTPETPPAEETVAPTVAEVTEETPEEIKPAQPTGRFAALRRDPSEMAEKPLDPLANLRHSSETTPEIPPSPDETPSSEEAVAVEEKPAQPMGRMAAFTRPPAAINRFRSVLDEDEAADDTDDDEAIEEDAAEEEELFPARPAQPVSGLRSPVIPSIKRDPPVGETAPSAPLMEAPSVEAPKPVPTIAASMPAPTESKPAEPELIPHRSLWSQPDYATVLEPGNEQEIDQHFILEQARLIEDTLSSFGAPGKVVEVNTGPVITQFGVEPDYLERRGGRTRVKVSAIAQLDKDIALALAARTIRIEAPVPGKGYVGIEVPNAEPSLVSLRDVMSSEEHQRAVVQKTKLTIGLGQSVDGAPVSADLTQMPHLLIAGTTGSGKSVCVNAIIACLLLQNSPDELQFIMVDPKRVELTGYNGIPHLISSVVVDLERIIGVLKWVQREMDERYKKLGERGARNIQDYNRRLPVNMPPMPYLVVVIDELADLMMLAPDETEKLLARLAQMSRATGIHLIISTQRPSVDVVTGLIKANFPARIAFAVASGVDSRVILDTPGAEKLLGRGDMLFQSPDASAPVRMQGVYVSDPEIDRITRYWKEQAVSIKRGGATAAFPKPHDPTEAQTLQLPTARSERYDPDANKANQRSFLAEVDKLTAETRRAGNDDEAVDDDMYEEALKVVQSLNKASVSLLQRRLRIGYTRAARLIDMMEERGVIGPAESGSKPRNVIGGVPSDEDDEE